MLHTKPSKHTYSTLPCTFTRRQRNAPAREKRRGESERGITEQGGCEKRGTATDQHGVKGPPAAAPCLCLPLHLLERSEPPIGVASRRAPPATTTTPHLHVSHGTAGVPHLLLPMQVASQAEKSTRRRGADFDSFFIYYAL